FIVSNRLPLTRGTHRHIESFFGDVDTDKDRANFQNSILLDDFTFLQHGSTLPMMRAWITQATVRALGEAERDDPCLDAVSKDLGSNDLSRPVSCLPYDDTHTSK